MKKIKKNFFYIFSLLLTLLAGAWFRFQGILTAYGTNDEIEMTKTGMLYTWRNLLRLNIYGSHPPLYYYLLFLANHFYFLIMRILGKFQRPYEIYVEYITDPFKFLLINRLVNYFLGSLLIVLVYLLTMQIYKNKKISLIASILAAFNPLLVDFSRKNILEIPVTFFCVLTLYFVFRIFKKGRKIDYLLAGLSLGMVLATKITGAFVFLAILLAHLLKNDKKNFKEKITVNNLYLSYLIAFLFFIFLQPYIIKDLVDILRTQGFNLSIIIEKIPFLEVIRYQSQVVKYGWVGLSFQKTPFIWIFPPILRNEPYLGYLYLFAILYSLLRFTKENLILVILVIVPVLWFGRITTMGQDIHYLLPLYPIIIILTAELIYNIFSRIKIKGTEIIMWIFIGFLIRPNIINILGAINDVKRIDTRFIASDWIKENIPSGKKFCLSPYSPFLYDPRNQAFKVRGEDELVKKALLKRTKNIKHYQTTEFVRWRQSPKWPESFTKEQIKEYENNRYLRITFTAYYPDIKTLKKEEIDYLIFSSYDYYNFTGENVYPKSNPLYFYVERTQKIYKSIMKNRDKSLILLKEFKPDRKMAGPIILIYQIKK